MCDRARKGEGRRGTLAGALRSACISAALAGSGCNGAPSPPSAASTSPTARSAPAGSIAEAAPSTSASTPSPSAVAAPSATSPPRTVAALRADAAADPARFKGTRAALDGYFSSRSLRRFGSGEHPTHEFTVVHVAVTPGDPDSVECEMREGAWPPVNLEPGDPIAVSGVWSMDRMLVGGRAEGGGPLHIASCSVTRRPAE